MVNIIQQLPNLIAYLNTPKGQIFSGQASWFDPWDINVYVTAITHGQTGHLLLQNLYTTTPHLSSLFYPLYTFAGYLFPKINPYLLFHILAILAGIGLLMTLWWILKIFITAVKNRLLGIFIITLGGGFGWLTQNFIDAADTSITGFTFHSSFQRAHEGIGMSLYFIALISFYLFTKVTKNDVKKKYKLWIVSLTALLALTFFYPYYLISYLAILGVYILINKNKLNRKKCLLALGTIGAISTMLTFLYFKHLQSTGFASITTQNLDAVSLIPLLIGYGLFILFFAIHLAQKRKPLPPSHTMLLLSWIGVSLVMAYLPLGFARFYLRGLFLPLTILMILIIKSLKNTSLIQLTIFFSIILFPLSQGYIFSQRISAIKDNNPWFYYSQDIRDGFEFLKNEPSGEQPEGGILATYVLGNHLPIHTHKPVYFGHLIQTPNATEKLVLINQFYKGEMDENQTKKWLKDNNILWVVVGPNEKKLEKIEGLLELEFENKTIQIYRVL